MGWAGVQTGAAGISYVTLDEGWHLSAGPRFFFSQVDGIIPNLSTSQCAMRLSQKKRRKVPQRPKLNITKDARALVSFCPGPRCSESRWWRGPNSPYPALFPSYPISQI